MKVTFRGRKAFPEGTIRDYGKYGRYKKVGKDWIRLKNGYPTFRKTLDYKKMKAFLILKGYVEEYFEPRGIKALRSLIKSKFQEEYDAFSRYSSLSTNSST